VLRVGRLAAGEPVRVPEAGHAHVFVAVGTATLDGRELATGDAARLTDAGSLPLVAGDGGVEALIWTTA
jgi:hypothetical protein